VTAIALSGRIGAGKSTVARELSSELGWPRASFGDFVRERADERGLGSDRDALQELGQELIEAHGFDDFVERVLAAAGIDPVAESFLIEGVRHVGALDALEQAVRGDVVLVYLETPGSERAERLMAREGSDSQIERWERHETERDVKTKLRDRADLVVRGTNSVAAAGAVKRFLAERDRNSGGAA
jgi:cytidylate kinase